MGDNNENKNSDGWKCVGETKSKNSEVIKILGLMVLSVAILVGGILAGMKGYDYLEKNKATAAEKEAVTQNSTETGEETKVVANESEPELTLEQVYSYVHYMTNTIIIPVDGKIMGREEITKASIEKALAQVESKDSYLFDEITKWENGDFNNAVDVHNYVWRKLDGNIGQAKDLNTTEIEKVKNSL